MIGMILLIILILIMLTLFLIPSVLSTSAGQAFLVSRINRQIPGKILIGKIDLGWFSGQHIEDFKLQTAEGETVLSFDSIHTSLPLIKAFIEKFSHAPFSVHNLQAEIVKDAADGTNLERALGIKSEHSHLIPASQPVILEKVNLDLLLQNQGRETWLKGTGMTRERNLEGRFTIDAHFGAIQKIHLDALNFPTLILDQLLAIQNPKYTGLAIDLLGDKIDLTIDQNQKELLFKGTSPQVTVNVQGSFQEQIAKIDSGNIKFNLPAENAEKISETLSLKIPLTPASAVQGELYLHDLQVPIKKPNWDEIYGNANLLFSPLSFAGHPSFGEIHLDKLSINAEMGRESKEAKIEVQASGTQNREPLTANFLAALERTQLASFSKLWQKGISFEGQVTHFPLALLCYPLSLDNVLCKKLEALLGPSVNANIHIATREMEGPIALSASGENGSLYLHGKLSQGVLTLIEPLEGSLKITPQLEQLILREILPFATAIVQADEPVQYVIDPAGFSAPIKDFAFESVAIGQGVLNLHKMTFNRASQMGKIGGLLRLNSPQFEVWFTPLYFNVHHGLISSSRVDMLIANAYPVAAWGDVNLLSNSLNMSIGLSGTAISKAFAVKGLPKEYMLSIPLHGSISNPQLDTSKMAARISALVAKTRGGTQGAIIGTFLEAASGAFTSDKVPPPTTNPLPWDDGRLEDHNSEANQVSAEDQMREINPVKEFKKEMKELKKGAGSLLQEFFR